MEYRQYQADLKAAVYKSWADGARNVLMQLATGGGKTQIFSDIVAEHKGATVAIAHRQELVGQMSLAMAYLKIPHRIIATPPIITSIVNLQQQVLHYTCYDPNAAKGVAGVRTLLNRQKDLSAWMQQVTLRIQDEDHHTLRENEWGRAAELFPNAYGLGVTATPYRMDGKGLGRHADGIVDALVLGPDMRDLIEMGYLTDYKIWAPDSKLDLSDVTTTAKGDYSPVKLKTAVRRSKILGDIVGHYEKHAKGMLGLTFATDVETAGDISRQFNEAGIPSEVIHAKTPDNIRAAILKRFANREILMLVNVDIFGEGFDLPALEVVIMARPTQSLGLYMQQFGRALRPMKGKGHAIIIDHVGNVARHGLPDAPRKWSLDRRDRRSKAVDTDIIPVRVCPKCAFVYERIYNTCPNCHYFHIPAGRISPEFVDGDLVELDPATLAAMRGDLARVDMDKEIYRAKLAAQRVPVEWQLANVKRHVATQEAQALLRNSIAIWAWYWHARKSSDSEIRKRFYFKFGIDTMSAQVLGADAALLLTDRINLHATELVK